MESLRTTSPRTVTTNANVSAPGTSSDDVSHGIGAPHFALPSESPGAGIADVPVPQVAPAESGWPLLSFFKTAGAICAWELRSFFLRPASYLLLLAAALTAGWGFSWLVTLVSGGAPVALRRADDPIVQFLGPNIFLIGGCTLLIPFLTMNSIAEERRRGTWESLLTAPVSPLAVVIAKFAAAWSQLLFALSPWVYFLVVLRVWNGRMTDWHGLPWFDGPGLSFDMGPVWGGCLGLAIVGATLTALGLFCSGLCRSPASAAVLSLTTMGLVLLTALAPRALAFWGFSHDQIAIVEAVSCWGHLARFSRGTFEPHLAVGHITACSILLACTAATCRRADGG
jgi:ABC-2 type transport system permease protein